MIRRIVIFVAAIAVLAAAQPADAQQAQKVYRIGFLTAGGRVPFARWLAAFKEGLRKRGYVEGKNVFIDARYADGHRERIPLLAAALVDRGIDVFLVHGRVALAADRAAKAAGRAIPIVLADSADPVGQGLVASLAHPGGDITGLTDAHSDLVAKRLQLLKQAVPSIARVAVFWSPVFPFTWAQLQTLEAVAPGLGITLFPVKFGREADVKSAFAALRRTLPDALDVLGYPFVGLYGSRIVGFARRNRLPAIFTAPEIVAKGGLMSYGASFTDLYRRAAFFVDKILKGARPADLPVEEPNRFYLTVNLKTAGALGITMPRSILIRTDRVIR